MKFPIQVLFAALLLLGCSSRSSECLSLPGQDGVSVFLLQQGWHTGIAFSAEYLEQSELLEELVHARQFVEVGWGDRAYYQVDGGGVWNIIRAALLPSSAALQITDIGRHPSHFHSELVPVELRLTPSAFSSFLEYVENTVVLIEGQPVNLGPALYGNGHFFEAHGTFHMLQNCNSWIAAAFVASGCQVSHLRSLTAGGLRAELARIQH